MKPYTKELISYAIAAFFIGILLTLFVDWVTGRCICEIPIWVYPFSGVVYSVLMTLFKYIADRRKNKKK